MRLTYLLIVLLLCFTLRAQHLLFDNISAEMAIPSQVCYNIMQDSKGYIWFSTESGLCQYNGQNLKIFDKKNGLPESSVYCVKEDDTGKLWFATSKNRILNFNHDSLIEAPFSKNYASKLKEKLELTYLLNLTNEGVYMSSQSKTFIAKGSELKSILKPDTSANFYFIKRSNQLIPVNGDLYTGLKNSAIKARRGYVKIIIEENGTKQVVQLPYSKTQYPYWRVLCAQTPQADFFSVENKLVMLGKGLSFKVIEMPDLIIALYVDKQNGLWVGTRKNGVYYYHDVSNMNEPMINLNELSVSGICEDGERGVWCSTLEKGIYYCKSKNIVSYSNLKGFDRSLDLLKNEKGQVFVSGANNTIIEFDGKLKSTIQNTAKDKRAIVDILSNGAGWYVATKSTIMYYDRNFSNGQEVILDGTRFSAGANQLCNVNGNVFGISYSAIFEVIGIKAYYKKMPLPVQGKCLLHAGKNILLFGTEEGLFEMDLNTNQVKPIAGTKAPITGILKRKTGEILVCTKGEGLFEFKNDVLLNSNAKLNLNCEILFDLIEDIYGQVWLACNKGLVKIVNGKTELYTSSYGLSFNEVYKVAADSATLYFSGVEGLYSLPLSETIANTKEPPFYLNKFYVNAKPMEFVSGLKLNHRQNNIVVDVSVLSYKERRAKVLVSVNEGPSMVKEVGNIEFANLEPGNYNIKLYALNNHGVKSKEPILLSFSVAKPFWQTGLFIVVAVIFTALIVFLLVRIIIQRIRKKEEEKTRINKLIAESQLTALQAQMNPHFIFNAINSIQRYVLQRDKQQAYDYLTKFSKLIRMVFNQSTNRMVLLRDELQMIKLYVELEQLRFDNAFEFDMEVENSVDEDTLSIPALLIQPYIENAIWHGLMNMDKNERGCLSLHLSLKQDKLIIIIADNGVGREASKNYKSEVEHKSAGIQLGEKRMEVLNKLSEFEGAKIEIVDLKSNEGKARGTRVEIQLPIHE